MCTSRGLVLVIKLLKFCRGFLLLLCWLGFMFACVIVVSLAESCVVACVVLGFRY